SFSALNLLIPIGTLFGYIYYKRTRINIKAYDVFFIVLYIYFYITYFALLPDLFFRPTFNEEVYVRASSNVVSQGLNLYLLFYLIAIKGKDILLPRRVIVYSTINLILIIIQGSRAGLIIGFIMFIIVLYYYLKEKNTKLPKYYFAPIILLMLLVIIKVGIPYYNSFQDAQISFRLSEDIRSVAQKTFLNNLDSSSLYFGYPSGYQFTPSLISQGGLTYTYNVALDVWNRYSIFGLFVLLVILFNRILNQKTHKIPLYLIVPILIYSSVESLFLPSYWDVLLFIALFLKKKDKVNL
ncbi:MAG TPA: hypothetical protein GXZ90_03885, partial [Clostridiales bacterium]|nr:hypothetical protein [Clostridiales bacterium]